KSYLAESGDFICVSNFPSAMLDLPVKSSQANESLLYEAFTDRIPPVGTRVRLVLTPKAKK
ncbi:MAG: YdjY domain-containing protein, partial [Pirellulales bacterium]